MDTADIKETDIQEMRQERIRSQYRILGGKIAYFRRLKGYTQEQLAERIGISANYLSQIERGKRENYPVHKLIMIAILLDIELKDLCE